MNELAHNLVDALILRLVAGNVTIARHVKFYKGIIRATSSVVNEPITWLTIGRRSYVVFMDSLFLDSGRGMVQ